MRRLLKWLKLFPAMVFPGLYLRNYLKVVRNGMRKYDMLNSPSEDYFRDRYMHIIDQVLKSNNLRYDNLRVLDVGCGPGRLTLEFLKRGSTVDALDAIPELLEQAKFNVKKANLDPRSVRWILGEVPKALFRLPRPAYDLVICMELLYAIPNPEESIKQMMELLPPRGVLVISLRTRLYYLLHSLISNDWQRFRIASEANNSQSIGIPLSWVDPADLEKTLINMGLTDIQKWGIGILTGIEGDPSAKFCLPHRLNQKDELYLAEVEDKIAKIYHDSGRYVVFSGAKR